APPAPRPVPPPGARPADGHVEIVPVVGVRAQPNAHDPRFGRFLALETAEDAAVARPAPARDAPALLGRVVIIPLFLGRDGPAWASAARPRSSASPTPPT